MSLSLVIVVCLIAGSVTFLLGWVFGKVHFSKQPPAVIEPGITEAAEPEEEPELPELSADAGELQQLVHQLENKLGESRLQTKELQNKAQQQQQMLAQVTEDRDRIRVEHGSQQRLINTLQSSKFDRDKAQQETLRQKQLWDKEATKLTAQIETLEQQLEQTSGQNANAPQPTGVNDGADTRQQLSDSKAQVESLTEQLTAMQDWAKPLAKENDELREVLQRMKKQIGMLRGEHKQAEQKIQQLTVQLKKARVAIDALNNRKKAAESELQNLRTQQAAIDTAVDNVSPAPQESTASSAERVNEASDPLEDTHTDLEAADDLKKLPGIGPTLERKFNQQGIFRYEQIAELSEQELNKLMKQMSARTSKAKRKVWPAEARRLSGNHNTGSASA